MLFNLNLNSIKFKISILAIFFLAAIMVIYSAVLILTFRFELYQELDNTLKAKTQKISNAVVSYLDILGSRQDAFHFTVNRVIAQKGDHPHKNKIEKLERLWLGQAQPLGISSDYIVFMDTAGMPLAYSNNLRESRLPPASAKEIDRALKGHPIFKNIRLGEEDLRVIIAPVTYAKLRRDQQYLIVIATSRVRIIDSLKQRVFTEFILIVIILILASLVSQIFARRVLVPVREITRTVRNIDYKDLSVRIKEENVDVEMMDLANSLNDMMSRLEKSFKYIMEFSAHVSHEHKTPLAILRGESELILKAERQPEEYQRVIQSNLEEIGRMAKIIEDLLLLTKLDYQPDVFKFEEFDLKEFFGEIAESSRMLAGQKNISVRTNIPKDPIRIHGDKVHLRRLFFNLINNAIKFTPAKGNIGIDVKPGDGEALVSISDNGIGIPEQNMDKVFDKFFHSNGISANNAAAGNGLGLSIAQSIARIHSGDIQVKSSVGKGSVFTVRLPLNPASVNNF